MCIINMNIVACVLSIILLIEPIFSGNDYLHTDLNKNNTVYEPNGLRFQRILRRKRRFLLFPPGAAIVTTMSFTKTLVPRSPSGINTIGECDIFYPLQTKIQDWYPTKPPPLPPPPQTPSSSDSEDYDEDAKQGPLPSNLGPMIPANVMPRPAPPPPPPPPRPPQNDQSNDANPVNSVPAPAPAPAPMNNAPFIPTRLPTDQEIGITPATIVSDPNFNTGSHPGEIYVQDNGKRSQKIPPRRFFKDYSKYYSSSRPYQQYYPHDSNWNLKTYNNLRGYGDKHYYSNKERTTWSREQSNAQTMQRQRTVHSNANHNEWQPSHRDNHPFESYANYREYTGNRYSRGSRERRDIFDQLESFMSFKQFDTRSCILRMICEAKHYLLPPGKSLFQDIFRILFTLPLENDSDDEYARASQSTEEDCDSVYSEKCQFSVLGLLMSKDRPIL